MKVYEILILIVVVYIIIYNLTLGFSLFEKKNTIVIFDCDSSDLQKIGFRYMVNRYPSNSINLLYNKDNKTITVREAFDIFLINNIDGSKKIQINNTVYDGIGDSVLITKFPSLDFRVEGEFKKQEIDGIFENTLMNFPERRNLFRIKESSDEDFLYVFKECNIKDINIIFI